MKGKIRIAMVATIGPILLIWACLDWIPGSIEGCWKYIYRVNCLCGDSYNFLHFKDGNIRMYASNHGPPRNWGTYKQVGPREYRVESNEIDMSVRPTLLGLRIINSTPDDGGFVQKLIYRVLLRDKCSRMIAEDVNRIGTANHALEGTGDPPTVRQSPQR